MYHYNLKTKILSLVYVFMLVSLALFVEKWGIKALFIIATVMLTKDAIITWSAEYSVDNNGLRLKDKFRDRQLVSWRELEYITITRKNKKWVALVTPDDIKYLKQNIENREELMHNIVEKIRGSKTIAIHDDINERFNLGLKLNQEGKIVHSRNN